MHPRPLLLVVLAALLLIAGCADRGEEIDDGVTSVTDSEGRTVGVMHDAELNEAMERGDAEVPVYDAPDGTEIGVFELGGTGGYRPHDG